MPEPSPKSNNKSKIIPILTGAVSLLLGIAYLLLVEFIDSRGEMLPAPPLSIISSLFDLL
ncbi:MAG: hypothetical protein AAGB01_05645 [Cyanobacteria bacterium P01_F01_bin.42]